MPAVAIPSKRWSLLAWPAPVWGMGTVAAILLIGYMTYRDFRPRPSPPAVALNRTTQPTQATVLPRPEHALPPSRAATAPVRPSMLADLTLPAYTVPTLRGGKLDARFEAGMKEYAQGNCGRAINALSQLPAGDANARAAAFYAGACQMHLGDYASAATLLHKVADTENSPRQEAALYLLAQVALAENDPAAAHGFLERTISLRGDFVERARAEDLRITAILKEERAILPTKSGSK